MIRGDYAQMKEVFEESLRLSRDADDKWGSQTPSSGWEPR